MKITHFKEILNVKNSILLLIFAFALFFIANPALAHTDDSSASTAKEVEGENIKAKKLAPAVTPRRHNKIRKEIDEKEQRLKERFDNTREEYSSRRDKIRARLDKKRLELRENMKERIEKIEKRKGGLREKFQKREIKLGNKSKERIKKHLKRFGNRFEMAINRIYKIGKRVQSRIEKLEAQGKDMTEERDLLEKSQNELETAREATKQFLDEAFSAIETENPQDSFQKAREMATIAKNGILKARETLIETVRALREIRSDNRDENTTNNNSDSRN